MTVLLSLKVFSDYVIFSPVSLWLGRRCGQGLLHLLVDVSVGVWDPPPFPGVLEGRSGLGRIEGPSYSRSHKSHHSGIWCTRTEVTINTHRFFIKWKGSQGLRVSRLKSLSFILRDESNHYLSESYDVSLGSLRVIKIYWLDFNSSDFTFYETFFFH